MRICVLGIPGIPSGKHNLKDPRLDRADELVEAKKKVYAQVDAVGPEELAKADALLVSREQLPDLILQDLEFIENRLGREPSPEERAALEKLRGHLETGQAVFGAPLQPGEWRALAAHAFATAKPVVCATPDETADPAALLLRAFQESGCISFLTVGGKENRAWPIPRGATAWEAAGTIHSDIQRGFIRAEVIAYDDLVAEGGETGAKRAGKLRLETKQYVLQDYDVVNFRFNAQRS